MTKMTLTVTEEVRDKAKKVAARQGTSVSSMFTRFVRAMDQPERDRRRIPIGPLTRRLSGIVKLPEGKTWEDVLDEAIMEKYGPAK